MERERLTRLLDEHGTMAPEDLRALKDMAQRFPWFSGAQLLHAAGERQSGQVLSDETLRTAAAHLPSRSALFDLAVDPSPRKPAPLRVVRVQAPVPVTKAAEPIPESAMAEPVPPPAAEPETPLAMVEEVTELPAAIEAGEPPEIAAPDTAQASERVEELDDQIMKAAMASAYDLTWQEKIPAPVPVDPPQSVEPSIPEPEPVMPKTSSNALLRFSEWLETADSAPELRSRPAPTPSPRTIPEKPAAKSESLDAKALIDRFIQHEPPAIPPKPAFFTPQQAAKKSLDDTSGMVTETLARIYEQQGNTAKAIEAYRRLALKYPEKSSYFAALSKALEEKQTP